jgi:hypothetical protein
MIRTRSRRDSSLPHFSTASESRFEAVVGEPREVERVETIVAPRERELLGPNPAEPVEELGSDGVRPGLAAGETHQGYARSLAAAQKRQHAAVLVVGMGGHVKKTRSGLELHEFLASSGRLGEGFGREEEPESEESHHRSGLILR